MRIVLFILLAALFLPLGALGQDAATEAAPVGQPAEEEFDFEDPFAEEEEIEIADPIEPFNRGVFWVNDKLYFYLFKPIARGYRVVPEGGRTAVGNFFSNLAFPVRFVNSTLQLKFGEAGNELRRFLLNSTVGVAGFFDPASQNGWTRSEEDFGQTLGSYGVGHGIYLVLPFFGPSSLRDGTGRIADYFLDPIPYVADGYELIAVRSYSRINDLSLDDDTYEKILEQALDPYLFVRNAYLQRRKAFTDK